MSAAKRTTRNAAIAELNASALPLDGTRARKFCFPTGRAGQRLLLFVLLACSTLLIVLPMLALLYSGFTKQLDGRVVLTLEAVREVVLDGSYWVALTNTLTTAVGAAALAVVIGVGLAWIITRTNVPGRRLLEQLVVMPMFIPPFVGAFAWLLIGAPRIGLMNVPFLRAGMDPPVDIYTHLGIIWTTGIYLAPYVFMIVASAFRNMDPTLEEAAQVSGLTRMQTAMKITLPVVSPAILAGTVLSFVISIGLFGTPILLGLSAQIYLVTSRIYLELQHFPPSYGVISILALYLMIITIVVNAIQRRILRGRSFVTVSGKNFRPREIRFGTGRYVMLALAWLYILLAAIIPIALIAAAALSTYAWSGRFTLSNLTFLWTSNDVRETLMNTVSITLISATAATLLGFGVSWTTYRTRLRGRQILDYLTLLPNSVPSLAFALGVGFFWLRAPAPVYGTMWIIVFAFVGRYVSYAARSISGSLVQIHPELEESARVAGYGWLRTLLRITLPLIRPSVVSGWVMLYSIFMTELSMVLPLYSATSRTFSILSFDTWSVGRFSLVASLSLLQLVIGVGVMYLVTGLLRRREAPL